MIRLASLFLAVCVVGGCVIERKAECVAAKECDQGRDDPYEGFEDDDEAFGEAGSCWQTEETAAPCVAVCNDFVAEQLADGIAAKNRTQIVACGGSIEE